MNSVEILDLLEEKMSEMNFTFQQFINLEFEDEQFSELVRCFGAWTEVDRARIHPDEYQYVVFFEKHDIHISFNASYDSWNGTDFSDTEPYEVVKATKTIEYWKAVN